MVRFIMICLRNKYYLFGNVLNRKMILNNAGKIIKNGGLNCLKNLKNNPITPKLK